MGGDEHFLSELYMVLITQLQDTVYVKVCKMMFISCLCVVELNEMVVLMYFVEFLSFNFLMLMF